jgi:serine/threonine-protein kinase
MGPRARIGAGVGVLAVIAVVVATVIGVVNAGHQPSSPQVVLPFTDLYMLRGVAVDGAGNLYVTDPGNQRVLKLAVGATTQTMLPFDGLHDPAGVAVDGSGSLYVTDGGNIRFNNRVLKLPAG